MAIERVEVRTKAQAEKALKAGQAINIVAGTFALTLAANADVHVSGAAHIQITAPAASRVVARGSSSVVAWESSRVVARGSSRVVARGSSRVVAWESSRVEAWESSSVVAWESSRVVARGSSSVVARGSSRVEARESSSVVAWGSSSVVAWESSRVEAWESSSVVARGSSSVVARESSRVEARGSSRVVAWGSSSVVARGYSMLQGRSPNATLTATATVCVNLWNGVTCEGGRQQVVSLSTAQDWCEYYGARIEGDRAIVYKAVGEGYMSQWGVCYAPGTAPKDEKWDGKRRECAAGGGLNFSPTPRHTHQFVSSPKHYLECRIALADMSIHWDGRFPEKVCAPEVVAPLIEVDVDGSPVAEA